MTRLGFRLGLILLLIAALATAALATRAAPRNGIIAALSSETLSGLRGDTDEAEGRYTASGSGAAGLWLLAGVLAAAALGIGWLARSSSVSAQPRGPALSRGQLIGGLALALAATGLGLWLALARPGEQPPDLAGNDAGAPLVVRAEWPTRIEAGAPNTIHAWLTSDQSQLLPGVQTCVTATLVTADGLTGELITPGGCLPVQDSMEWTWEIETQLARGYQPRVQLDVIWTLADGRRAEQTIWSQPLPLQAEQVAVPSGSLGTLSLASAGLGVALTAPIAYRRGRASWLNDEIDIPRTRRDTPLQPKDPSPAPNTPHLNTEFKGQAASAPLRVGQPTPLFVWVGERIEADQGRTSRPFAFDLSQQAQPVAFEVRVDADPECWQIEAVQTRLVVTPQGATETAAVFRVTARRPGADKLYLSVVQAASGAAVQHVWLPVTAAEQAEAAPAAPAPTAVRLPLNAADLQPRLVQLTFARGRDAESFSVVVDADLPGGRVHQFYSVPLSAAAVQNATLRLRQELERIVLFAEERDGATSYPFADPYRLKVDEATARRAAAPLADAGQQVWHLLFNAPRAPEGLKRIGAALRDLPHGSALQVVIESQQFIVPWALLYDRPGEITPATLDWAGFWGYRYVLDVLPPGDYPDPTIAARPPTARLLFNDDAELRRFADAQERAAREGLGQVETARGAEQAREALRAAAGGESTLLYVFCHGQHASGLAQPGALASESALTFGRGDRVRLADMRRIVSGPLPGRPLVFLNACEGATQDAFFYDGFMPFFIEECGARGFIGTEVKAPQLLAHDVALRFMQLFAAGVPVGEALWRLRRAYLDEHHNPLALNYTLYGLDEVRLVTKAEG